MNLPDRLRQDFEKKGYALVPAVFTGDEIEELKRLVLLSEKEVSSLTETVFQGPGTLTTASTPAYYSSREDLLSNPYLRHLVYDDRILAIVRTLLGKEDILYMSEGSWTIHRNTHTMPMVFHKDNTDRLNGNGPDWTGPYHVIRLGIYLQDHSEHSSGISVFEGSHTKASVLNGKVRTEWGKRVYLKTKPGDVAVWYLKTSHAGDWGIPKMAIIDRLPLKVLKRLHHFGFLFKRQPELRAAIFMSFGIDSSSTDRYKQYLRTRKYSYDRAQNSTFDTALAAQLKAEKRLEILNLNEVMKGVRPEEAGGHREIPF